MRSNLRRIFNSKLALLLAVILLAIILVAFAVQTPSNAAVAFADGSNTLTDSITNKFVIEVPTNNSGDLTNSIQVTSNENAGFFGDHVVSPRWFTYEPLLGWTTQEDYSRLLYGEKEPEYHANSSVVAPQGYVNEERWAFNGTDSTGITRRLEPVNSFEAANNITANGTTTVTVSKLGEPRGKCKYTSDIQKMKDLETKLRISGDKTKVATGKILYRQKSTLGNWNSWSYKDLNSSVKLTFTQNYVQIAVIYELKETGTFLWDVNYYRICGIYRFDIA